MKLTAIEQELDNLGIAHYPDALNPDYQIHFDIGDRGFYFESMFPLNPLVGWELYEVGPSSVLGEIYSISELHNLLISLMKVSV